MQGVTLEFIKVMLYAMRSLLVIYIRIAYNVHMFGRKEQRDV